MLSIRSILDAISTAKGPKARAAVLAYHSNNETLKEVMRLALSPHITFGLKAIPGDDKLDKCKPYPANIDTALYQCRDVIAAGALPANSDALKRFVADMLSSLPSDDRDVIRRVLKKRLDIGLGKTAVLKQWPGLWWAPDYMGAKSSASLHRMTYPCIVQEKVSGSCVYVDVTPGVHDECALLVYNPRRGSVYHLQPDMLAALGQLGMYIAKQFGSGKRVTLCCEGLVADFGYDVGMRRPIAKSEADCNAAWTAAQDAPMDPTIPAFLSIYDVRLHGLPDEPFFVKETGTGRLSALTLAFEQAFPVTGKPSCLWLTTSWTAEDDERATAIFRAVEANGGEGTIRKAYNGLWRPGKPSTQVKEKTAETVALVVTGTTEHTAIHGAIGALVCACADNPDFEVLVGTGLTLADRFNKEWLGAIINVEAHRLSETKLSLTNPRYKGLRKDLSEADTYAKVVAVMTNTEEVGE